MAKTAVGEAIGSDFPFGRGRDQIMPKRKTPSELRGEQLKRRSFELPTEKQLSSLLAPDLMKKTEPSRNPKYIDTRLSEHFQVKKSSFTLKGLYMKGKSKDSQNSSKDTDLNGDDQLNRPSIACKYTEKNKEQSDKSGKSELPGSKPSCNSGFQTMEKCSQGIFRTVAQLSVGRESADPARIDMDKALKRFIARDQSVSEDDSSKIIGAHPSMPSRNANNNYKLTGNMIPLDFTLKTTIRLVSSSSVKWLNRLISNGKRNALEEVNYSCDRPRSSNQYKFSRNDTPDLLVSKALRSWKYPQSTLPSSIISTMSLSASDAEMNFLKRRQHDWEESFHNLYYMLRLKKCGTFYVYTSQFVALFVGDLSDSKKSRCSAYLSQSTNGLRSLLAENGISFSMPLCLSTVGQATADDLVELSEIEKINFGQTHHLDLSMDVDNSPQSLLAFIGNKNVHGLFDFLLNYRSFVNSLSSFDVPVLLSAVPFLNSSLYMPEVKCKEMRRANIVPSSSTSESDDTESYTSAATSSVCSSIEIKDEILPPWVVSGICAAMASQSLDFEACFTLEPRSAGLNVAVNSFHLKHGTDDSGLTDSNKVGVAGATVVPWLCSAFVRSLKHSSGSYSACVASL